MSLVDAYEDAPDIYSVSRQRAAKEYRCDECRTTIKPGDRYRRDFQAVSGEGYTFRLCADCDELANRFHDAAKAHGLGFIVGDLHSAIRELRAEYGITVPGFDYGDAA